MISILISSYGLRHPYLSIFRIIMNLQEFFTISLKDANGNPLGDTRISISFIWAVPNIVGVVQLYDGTTPVNSPFEADTDDFGVYILRVDFQSGVISYFGDIEVRSGDAFGSASLTVQS